MARKAIILLLAAAAVALMVQPGPLLSNAVLKHFGNPTYEGIWILIPHLLFYSTLSALLSAVVWVGLARAGWIAPLHFRLTRDALVWGVIGILATIAMTVAFLFATGMSAGFHAPKVDPWLMAANLFSNFYEELVFRGFVLAALAAVFGFWPAAVLSSLAFGFVHTQYPLSLQLLIAASGFLWCWLAHRTDSLITPLIAHMGLDWIMDPFF
jgi:membrane protease YdiL (CAAX protease family)